jgi:hypothetical protein
MMAEKPRFRANTNGTMTPRNGAARRAALLQQYANAGEVTSRGTVAPQARRKSMGGAGG